MTALTQTSRPRTPTIFRPVTRHELLAMVHYLFGLHIPTRAVSPGSTPPFDYLCHAFFEPAPGIAAHAPPARDCIVWAPRGGGKTVLGAVATALDLLFKPGIQVRILGGSLEQSSKMFAHLLAFFDSPRLAPSLARRPTQRRLVLKNGSACESLAASQRSVRGVRVQKLRCDEVDEFDTRIWDAAQRVISSARCADLHVHGAVEAISTIHRPWGLMTRLANLNPAPAPGNESPAPQDPQEPTNPLKILSAPSAPKTRVFRWNILDIAEKCAPERPCNGCEIVQDCHGLAKNARGFVPIDDLISARNRSSNQAWDAEMMCRRPQLTNAVYPAFNPASHVKPAPDLDSLLTTLETPNSTAATAGIPARPETLLVSGLDFGLRSPLVFLWAAVQNNVLHVLDEYAQENLTLEKHILAIRQRPWPAPAWIGADPAGAARNALTGYSEIAHLRKAGFKVRAKRLRLRDAVELIRSRLDHARLFIHPRCTRLIEAIEKYHFDQSKPFTDEPVKDGNDHWCDALRYLVVNFDAWGGKSQRRFY